MVKKGHFERMAKYYDFLTRILMFGTYDRVKKRIISGSRVKTALDLCCGTGYVTGDIAADKVFALDLSPSMLKVNVEKNRLKKNLRVVVGDAFSIPFPDETFDAIYNTLASHEFKNFSLILKETMRVLKPGGELVLYDFSQPKNRIIRYTYLPFLKHVVELGTFYVYDDLEWRKMLSRTGFRDIEMETLYKASVLIRAKK